MKLLSSLLVCLFIASLGVVVVRAEDSVEGEEGSVETENGKLDEEVLAEDNGLPKGSPDADITILFTKPAGNGMGK